MLNTEISNKKGLSGIGRPFAIRYVPIPMNIKAILFETSAELFEAALGIVDCLDPFLCMTVSASESIFERRKPWIELYNP